MNRYCWIRGTYYVNQNYDLNMLSIEARDESLLHYYQWVYFFLIIQAFLFYLPRILWCFISQKLLDYDLYNMVDAACKHELYANDSNIILKYLSSNFEHRFNYLPVTHYERYLYVEDKISTKNNESVNFESSSINFGRFTWKIRRTILALVYIAIKILYLLVACFQLILMNSLLSNKTHSFYGEYPN